jgi:hypothetical protein
MSDAGGGEFVVCVAVLYGSLFAYGKRPWMLCAEPVAFVGLASRLSWWFSTKIGREESWC